MLHRAQEHDCSRRHGVLPSDLRCRCHNAWASSKGDVNRLAVVSNPGFATVKGASRHPSEKRLRVDFLKDSIKSFPCLIRQVDGMCRGGATLDRFERRAVDVNKWQACLEDCAQASSASSVFGGWLDWQWASDASGQGVWIAAGMAPCALPQGDQWQITHCVNVSGLERYLEAGGPDMDRWEQARDFLTACRQGQDDNVNVVQVRSVGHQKLVGGTSMGRFFFGHLSMTNLSRQARAAASPAGSIEYDMPNAIVHCALEIGQEQQLQMPCFKLYAEHKQQWRQCVSQWLSITLEEAKTMLLKACFGYVFPSKIEGCVVACPLLEGLAAEAQKLRTCVATLYPDVVRALECAGRPRPETSALAYVLFDRECRRLREFVELLPKHGFQLVAPIYDAVIVTPCDVREGGDASVAGCEDALLSEFQLRTGIRMQRKALSAPDPEMGSRLSELLADMVLTGHGVGMGQIYRCAGDFACLPTALGNLFPDAQSLSVHLTAAPPPPPPPPNKTDITNVTRP